MAEAKAYTDVFTAVLQRAGQTPARTSMPIFARRLFLFPRGSMGTRRSKSLPPLRGRWRGKGVARRSARGGINRVRLMLIDVAGVSRSHAPAWECIHYADRFLCPRGSMGTRRSKSLPPLRGRWRGKGVARRSARGGINRVRLMLIDVAGVSRSHAPAWECIHYADRFLCPRGSMGTRRSKSLPPLRGRWRDKGVARRSARGGINRVRLMLIDVAGVSRSHAPAWECIHYADRFLFPRGSMGTRRSKSLPPLEGEMARQGRSPQQRQRGDQQGQADAY